MIRQLREKGMSISAIARELHKDRKTIRNALQEKRPPSYAREPLPSVLDAYKPYIQARFAECELSAVRLLDEVRKQGYGGAYTVVKDYVRGLKVEKQTVATVRFETKPGGQGQVDWARFGKVVIDGETRELSCFVMVLGYSRMRYVEYTTDRKTPTLIQCHLNAFAYFGGYTREILYDNLHEVVLEHDRTNGHKWTPLFQDFAQHHGFVTRLCQPYRAQTKGKVERSIRYVRENFWNGRKFESLQDMNTQAIAWCDIVNSKPHSTTHVPPRERLAEEDLLRLDAVKPYVVTQEYARKVSRECFVSLMGNKYSVPYTHAGREALVKVSDGKLRVLVAGDLAAEHDVLAGSRRVSRNKDHFLGILKTTRRPKADEGSVLEWPEVPEVERRELSVYDRVLDDYAEVKSL